MNRLLALGTSIFGLAAPAAFANPTLVASFGPGANTSWSPTGNGVYQVVVEGAGGGSGSSGVSGGSGGVVIDNFVFLAGQQINVAVGMPGGGDGAGGGGGGGGSFVTTGAGFTNTGVALAVAGGGGGVGIGNATSGAASVSGFGASGYTLGTTSSGKYANGTGGGAQNWGGNGTYAGYGGYSATDQGVPGYGAGGGGFRYNGDNDSTGNGGASFAMSLGGGAVTGACSGIGGDYMGYGGFGGGGSGGCYGGGGGGGFTGGNGGLVGGGGGSYISGLYAPVMPANQYGYTGGAAGTSGVQIFLIAAYSDNPSAPEPATLGLLGAGLIGLGLARRRRHLGA